ncbi:HU family DNA-binding protein [Bacteroides thetaiotaomicron]|uniref:HU family DNA-binding protein n=1 Tax=Bacteroides thetaiotaomicron TaxID=818 RepID=UPI0021657118|nr:HU family DNA-binding protein [Bacteroides thetaiotaomicron]MCS3197031.1 HU family DNA-binding protein [Bacteroides thetaiotaomicron]
MNERLTIQDLIDLLAAKHSMTKKDAEAFVKEFFLLIEQALENEKTVKIKGLGTFKLVDVDSRESVNVNTGERFQIKGHTKVSFTPDTNLRDTINKPFAHFETVVLNEGTVLEDTPMEESDEEEGAVSDTETEMIDSEIAGNENVGGDIQEEIQPEEPVIEGRPTAEEVAVAEVPETDANETGQTETETEPVATEEPEVEELPEVETEPESVSEEAPEEEPVEESSEAVLEPDFSPATEEPTEEQSEETIIEEQKPETETAEAEEEETVIAEKAEVTAEQIIAQELHKANMEPVTPKMQPEIEQPKATYTDKDSDKKEKSAIPYLIATIIIVLLLCGGAILFIYYPDLFSSSSDKNVVDMPEVTQPVQPEAQLSDTIAHKDTVVEAVQPQPVVKKEPAAEPVKAESKPAQQQPAASAYSDSASYKITGTKTKYTIKEGETLTKVSLRFYGTKAMWPYIVKHNPKVIKNPDNVPYGTTIEIPELTKE